MWTALWGLHKTKTGHVDECMPIQFIVVLFFRVIQTVLHKSYFLLALFGFLGLFFIIIGLLLFGRFCVFIHSGFVDGIWAFRTDVPGPTTIVAGS